MADHGVVEPGKAHSGNAAPTPTVASGAAAAQHECASAEEEEDEKEDEEEEEEAPRGCESGGGGKRPKLGTHETSAHAAPAAAAPPSPSVLAAPISPPPASASAAPAIRRSGRNSDLRAECKAAVDKYHAATTWRCRHDMSRVEDPGRAIVNELLRLRTSLSDLVPPINSLCWEVTHALAWYCLAIGTPDNNQASHFFHGGARVSRTT